ncbi:MAG: YtxH domain-containing protein [Bacillota bacterium]
MSKNKSLLCGLLVGGLIGGIAVLMSTPSTGKELRGQLQINRRKLEETLQQLKTESIALKDQIIITAKESSGVVKEVSTDLKRTINQFQQEIAPHKKDLQKEIEEVELKIKQLEQTLQ